MGDVEISSWLKGLPLAPEFHPTETEFADPIAYISKIEKEASTFGICKVIPPLPKPSKKYVLSNLNKSLSKCPELCSDTTGSSSSQMGFGDRGNEGEARAVFTTRQQELGLCPKMLKGPMPIRKLAIQKQVWQSGEVYTLDQFESKSKAFARSQLSGVKEVTPLLVESLFWKAASEKPIYVEYANDVPGSGFGEPEQPFRYLRKRKRRRRFNQKHQEGVGCEKLKVKTTIDQTYNADKTIPCSSTLSSDESSRLSRQKSLMNAAGSDREGTAGWKISNSPWNLQVIAQSRGSLTRFMVDDIPGVTSPMIYIGMLFSWFAWHVEDHELHSLNFLHMGAPKTWYAVPGDYAFALEEVVRVQGYGEHLDRLGALTLLGEKTTLLSPEVVVSSGIPCCRLVQHPGEFVVTFPRAYHIGFSHGYNCGEAANFATSQWLKVAKEAAVRRAAMNYLPMLSHQQLLYLLTMSFVSRVPRTLLPGVRSSRLRDRIKEEREILVKKAFLDDLMTENLRFIVLLRKSSTSYAVLWDPDLLPSPTNGPSFPSSSLEPSDSLFGVKSSESEKDGSDKVIALHDATATLCGRTSIDGQENNHDDKVNSTSSYVEPQDFLYGDDDDLPYGLHVDSGTLACVACGVLGFPFMCIMQPSERASREHFHEECEAIQVGLGSMKSLELPTPSMDVVFKNFDSENAKAITVELMVQDKQEDNQTGNLSARCGGHTSVPEIPDAARDFKLTKNVSLECTSNADNTLPEVIADKEPKQNNALCHSIRAASSSGLNESIHCRNSFSPLPEVSEIPVDLPTPSTFDGGNEIYQLSHITDKAKENDMQIDTLNESEGNAYLKVDATMKKDLRSGVSSIVPCYKTEGSLREPAQRSGDEVSRKWNTSNVFLRPRIFCLEHAIEIEELLQCRGGANVLLICHSDYPKIKAHAPSISEEVGVHFNCEDISLETASQADLDLINISIDDEAEECGEDWTSKLALNLRHCVNVRKLSPPKRVRHALALSGLFSDQVRELSISTLKWQSRKSRTRNKGIGFDRSKMQDNLHKKKGEDKMVSHSSVNVFTKKQVLGSMNEPCIAQASRSRGRGRPRKHALKGSGSANGTTPNDTNEPENKRSESAYTCPPHSNEKVENDSAQVVNSFTIMDLTAKSSEALEVISTTPETNMVGGTYDSISNAIDNPVGKIPENQVQSQTSALTDLAGEGCYAERSQGLPDIAFTDVSSAEETKKALKVCDSTSSVCLLTIGAPDVENSKMQQEILGAEGITMEGGICDFASICTVDSSWAREKTHAIEGNPVVAEVCNSAKLPPLPALNNCANKTPMVQEATEVSCDSETSADVATVSISMSKHSDKQAEIQTTDERSSGDNPHDTVKLAGPPTFAVSMVESTAMMPDIQTATENCSLMGEVCDYSEPADPPTISVSVVENSEGQHDTQITDKTRALQEVQSSRCGIEKANSSPILVYSRVRRNQRKRKAMVGEEMKLDAQESCIAFIRSPCEGLRSRTGRKVAGEMDACRTPEQSKPAKKAKLVPGSSGGYRDEENSKASYRCDLDGCHMSFTTKGELQLHKRNRCTHEGCGKRFSSHKYAMQHERVHNDDRPLKCPWKGCGMSFKWAWARTEHMRLHTGERPYQCKFTGCGLTFMFVSEFSRHRRRTGHFVN